MCSVSIFYVPFWQLYWKRPTDDIDNLLTLILKHISLCDLLRLSGFKQNFFNSFFAIFVFIFCVFVQGLFAENKEKLINGALLGLLEKEGDQNVISAENLEAQFHALRRLVASKAGFQAFTSLPK